MKRSRKPVIFFLIFWLTTVASGYLLSGNTSYAVGVTGGSCGACAFCATYTQALYGPPENGTAMPVGWTLAGTTNDWQSFAINGFAAGGQSTPYYNGIPCSEGGGAEAADPPVNLTYWEFGAITVSCTLPASPSSPYWQEASDGTNQIAMGMANQRFCGSPGSGTGQ